MYTRITIQRTATLVFVLLLLTACGDVSDNGVNIDSNIGSWPNSTDYYANKTFTDQVTVEDHIRFRIDAVNGRINISGEPDGETVVVTAEARVGSDSYDDALEGLDLPEVRVTAETEEILIQTLQPEIAQGRSSIVDYTITIPSDFVVETSHVNGNLIVRDIENSISADMVNC